jgi:hypothetical protein
MIKLTNVILVMLTTVMLTTVMLTTVMLTTVMLTTVILLMEGCLNKVVVTIYSALLNLCFFNK